MEAAQAQDAANKAYIQQAVGSGKSPADELASLADLKQRRASSTTPSSSG